MKFETIIADPPWNFGDGLNMRTKKTKRKIKRSAQSQYKVMKLSEIKAMDVASISNPDGCILCLWVPSTMLKDGLDVMSSWGFTFKTTYIWVKTKKDARKEQDMNKMTRVGMGRLFRSSHEIALIGIKGKNVYKTLMNKGQRSVCFDLNLGHSIKPEKLHESLELMFPTANKLEIFARKIHSNWISIGDGVTGKDVNTSIQELLLL